MYLPLLAACAFAVVLGCSAEIVESFRDLQTTEFDFVVIGGELDSFHLPRLC
jgi:hypothetical protein